MASICPQSTTCLITCKLINRCGKKYTQNVNKLENKKRQEVAVLLEEEEKRKPYLFETAPIHGDTGDFERSWISPHLSWKVPVAKSCKAVSSWTIG